MQTDEILQLLKTLKQQHSESTAQLIGLIKQQTSDILQLRVAVLELQKERALSILPAATSSTTITSITAPSTTLASTASSSSQPAVPTYKARKPGGKKTIESIVQDLGDSKQSWGDSAVDLVDGSLSSEYAAADEGVKVDNVGKVNGTTSEGSFEGTTKNTEDAKLQANGNHVNGKVEPKAQVKPTTQDARDARPLKIEYRKKSMADLKRYESQDVRTSGDVRRNGSRDRRTPSRDRRNGSRDRRRNAGLKRESSVVFTRKEATINEGEEPKKVPESRRDTWDPKRNEHKRDEAKRYSRKNESNEGVKKMEAPAPVATEKGLVFDNGYVQHVEEW